MVPAEILFDAIETELRAAAWSYTSSCLVLRQVPERTIIGARNDKAYCIVTGSDGSLLLRELNHRVNNELTSAICTISAKAVESDDAEVKAALSMW